MAIFNPKNYKTMKNLFKSMMLVAVAAMGFTACSKEAVEEVNPTIEHKTYTMNFVADAPDSRTSVEINGSTATFKWAEEGETFTFVQNTTEGLEKGTNVEYAYSEGLAEITATFTEANSPIVAVYPEDAWVSNNDNYNKAKLIVRKDQDIVANTFDPNADLMVSKELTPEVATDTHLLQFTRLVAIGKMTLKNLPIVGSETIQKVNFAIDSENALTGRLYIDLETAKVSEWGYYGNAFTEVSLINGNIAAAAANEFFFTCMPAIVAAGETFTVTVTTDAAIYTHSVTIPEGKSIEFTSGRVSTFSVNMADAVREDNSGIALPWTEDFSSEDLDKYDIVNGASNTKVYLDGNLALGATAGEILIGNSGGSMSATFASDGTEKTLNLWFKSNKPENITVSTTTEDVTVTKLSNYGYTVTLAEGVSTFKLTFANNTNSNARVDDIVLTEEAPVVESLQIADATLSFTAGDEFVFGGTVNAIYQNGVSEDVTEDVEVNSDDVDMNAAGTYTVTVSYEGVSATYDITIQAAGVKTETFDLSVTGTYNNNSITWTENGITIVQEKGAGSSAPNSSYKTASTMRLYQGNTLTFSSENTITQIEFVTKSTNYGKTATVDVGTLTNPKTSGCTITWTGSENLITITNGTGSGGSQLQTSKITITYLVDGTGSEEPEASIESATIENVVAVGGDFEYTPVISNSTSAIDDNIQYDGTVVTEAIVVDGVVVYTVAENTGNAREGWFKLALADDASVTATITVKQLATEQGGGDEPGTGDEETFTLSGTFTYADSKLSLTQNDVTVTQYIASGNTAVNSDYNTAETLRVYKGHALSFTGKTITRIEITYDGSRYGNSITVNTGNFAASTATGGTHVWTGSSDNVIITNNATSTNVQLRPTKIVITYEK